MMKSGVLALGLLIGAALPFAAADSPIEHQQSTTGPKPAPGVYLSKGAPPATGGAQHVLAGVPSYLWRHGCGPTALGMVFGYYDARGFTELIPGDASLQTAEVNQAIASQGSGSQLFGAQRHYEDYALPIEDSGTLLQDRSPFYPLNCHIDDSIADFMHTSWSIDQNQYGWSWSSRIGPAFESYADSRNPDYDIEWRLLYGAQLTIGQLISEIDSGRPMVFLVDTDADAMSDHFITIIGYNAGPPAMYACRDTWNHEVHWYALRPMSASYSWGTWGGWALELTQVRTATEPACWMLYDSVLDW